MRRCLFILILFLFFSENIFAASQLIMKNLAQIHKQEPTFADVMEIVFNREKLNLEQIEIWKKKMRSAPWVPKVSAGYDRVLKDTHSASVNDNISVTSNGVNVGPADNNSDQTVYAGDVFRVRAVWELDETIFHPQTLSASREARDLSQTRMQISDYLFKTYAKRRELMGEYFLLKKKGDDKVVIVLEQIRSFTDQLDAWTDEKFSKKWWRGE